jgi:hypothetical protein
LGDKSKRLEMNRACSTYWREEKNAYIFFVREVE